MAWCLNQLIRLDYGWNRDIEGKLPLYPGFTRYHSTTTSLVTYLTIVSSSGDFFGSCQCTDHRQAQKDAVHLTEGLSSEINDMFQIRCSLDFSGLMYRRNNQQAVYGAHAKCSHSPSTLTNLGGQFCNPLQRGVKALFPVVRMITHSDNKI